MALNLANGKSYTVAKGLRETADQLRQDAGSIFDLVNGELEKVTTALDEKKEELAALEVQLDETRRVKTLDLDLQLKKDRKETFDMLAAEFGYAIISDSDLQLLKDKLAIAQADRVGDIEEAVKAAQSKVYAEKHGEINRLKADHQVATAKLEANNETLEDRVSYLQSELARMTDLLKVAQESNVKIAEAAKAPVVNTGK